MMGKFVACFAAVALLAACTTDPYTGERRVSRTAIGAGVGALAGAGVGVLIGNHRGRNAAIGAGIGALSGAAVGGYMDLQAKKLREELAGTGVSVTKVGDNIVLNMPGNVTFATDHSDVQADFYPVLNSVAKVLKEYEKTLIHVTGHTDSTGGYQYNMDLSQRRADSVSGYLAAQGVQNVRLQARGFGPDRPVAGNDSPEGRQQNRRVEITLEPLTA
jgi:outer membrane protein OmpA-like peptidoglycan-associated protein